MRGARGLGAPVGNGAGGARARRRRRDTGTTRTGDSSGRQGWGCGRTGDSEQENGRRPGMAQGGELVGAREGVMGARVVVGTGSKPWQTIQRKEAEPEMPGAPRVWVGPMGNPGGWTSLAILG